MGREDVISCVHFLTADGIPASDPHTPARTGAFPCPLFRTARVTHAPLFIPNSERRLSCSSWSLSKRGWEAGDMLMDLWLHGRSHQEWWERILSLIARPHSDRTWSLSGAVPCVFGFGSSSDNLYAIKDACSPWSCHCYSGPEVNTLHLVTLRRRMNNFPHCLWAWGVLRPPVCS